MHPRFANAGRRLQAMGGAHGVISTALERSSSFSVSGTTSADPPSASQIASKDARVTSA
jgi:hypothetical protein